MGDSYAKFHVTSKLDNYKWGLVAAYGAAQDEHKTDFLAELARIRDNEPLPIMVGGDFNIIRHKEEKNNENFNSRWPFLTRL
jgi:hypothetical protein